MCILQNWMKMQERCWGGWKQPTAGRSWSRVNISFSGGNYHSYDHYDYDYHSYDLMANWQSIGNIGTSLLAGRESLGGGGRLATAWHLLPEKATGRQNLLPEKRTGHENLLPGKRIGCKNLLPENTFLLLLKKILWVNHLFSQIWKLDFFKHCGYQLVAKN